MKKAILILFLVPQLIMAQSFQELIKAYEIECSETVKDTIKQNGTVTYKHLPVRNESGDIVHFVLGKPDTTWAKPKCHAYKRYASHNWQIGTLSANPSLTFTTNDGYILGTVKEEPYKSHITRKYVCNVKKREVKPFSNHFWNWIKSRKL